MTILTTDNCYYPHILFTHTPHAKQEKHSSSYMTKKISTQGALLAFKPPLMVFINKYTGII